MRPYILGWLCDSRTTVVHKEDLELYSMATVQVLNWRRISLLKIEISPFLKTDQLAKDLIKFHVIEIPKIMPERTILNVEREWIVNDLPDKELLSVIGYSYNFLSNLVNSVHHLSGCEAGCECGLKTCESRPCMTSAKDDRSVNINLGTGDILKKVEVVNITGLNETPEFRQEVEKRKNIGPNLDARDFLSLTRQINEKAKQLLVYDKGHAMIFMLYFESGNCEPILMKVNDQAEKLVAVRNIAEQAKERRAEGVIAISESWVIAEEDFRFIDPSIHPNKREALQVIAVGKKGVLKLITLFSRDNEGNILLEETQEMDNSELEASIMASIIEALDIKI